MNNYIVERLKNRAFTVPFSCKFMGIDIQSRIKIDTGAAFSLLPLRSVAFENYLDIDGKNRDNFYRVLKQQLLDTHGSYIKMKTAGSTADDMKDIKPLEDKLTAIPCEITDFEILDMPVSNICKIGINCDTVGNVLLGMDILKQFDFHCGESLLDDEENGISEGDYIFVGCLKNKLNPEYTKALKGYFGLAARCI